VDNNHSFFLSLDVMIGIRGAIASVENSEDSILESSKILFNTLLEKNNLVVTKIVSVIFTVTKDLNTAFPAKAIRDLGYDKISALDTLAPDVEGDLLGCIRILVIYEDQLDPNHVYLGEAKNLRPDR
jgi:chorismate mutase